MNGEVSARVCVFIKYPLIILYLELLGLKLAKEEKPFYICVCVC